MCSLAPGLTTGSGPGTSWALHLRGEEPRGGTLTFNRPTLAASRRSRQGRAQGFSLWPRGEAVVWTMLMGVLSGSSYVGEGSQQYLQISETVELLRGLPEMSRPGEQWEQGWSCRSCTCNPEYSALHFEPVCCFCGHRRTHL